MLSFLRSQEKKPGIIFIKFSERLMPRIGFLEQATTCDSCLIFSQSQVALQIPKDAETIGDVLTFIQTKYRIGGIITLNLAKTVFPPELPVEALEMGISRGQVFTLEPLRTSRFIEEQGCKARLSFNCCSLADQVGDESEESELENAQGAGDAETETAGSGEESENGEDDLAEQDVGSEDGGDSAEGDSEELHVDDEDDGMGEDSDNVEDDSTVRDADNEDSGRDSVSAEDESTEVEADDDYDERADDVSGLHEQSESMEGRDEVDTIENEGAALANNGHDISSGYDGGIESNEDYKPVAESTVIIKTDNSEGSAEATTQPFGAELSMTLNEEGATVESNGAEITDVVDSSVNQAIDDSAAVNDQSASGCEDSATDAASTAEDTLNVENAGATLAPLEVAFSGKGTSSASGCEAGSSCSIDVTPKEIYNEQAESTSKGSTLSLVRATAKESSGTIGSFSSAEMMPGVEPDTPVPMYTSTPKNSADSIRKTRGKDTSALKPFKTLKDSLKRKKNKKDEDAENELKRRKIFEQQENGGPGALKEIPIDSIVKFLRNSDDPDTPRPATQSTEKTWPEIDEPCEDESKNPERWVPVPSLSPFDIRPPCNIKFEYGDGEIMETIKLQVEKVTGDGIIGYRLNGKSFSGPKRRKLLQFSKTSMSNVFIWSKARAAGIDVSAID